LPCAIFGREIGGGDFGVVLGLEGHAFAHQFAAQIVVVRERAVVHQALVGAGRERMGAERGHGRFRCHAGMADAMRAGHGANAKAGDDILRQADFLVDLDAVARAHDADVARSSWASLDRASRGLAASVSTTACVLFTSIVTLASTDGLQRVLKAGGNRASGQPTGW
jgi:hypothetical protein